MTFTDHSYGKELPVRFQRGRTARWIGARRFWLRVAAVAYVLVSVAGAQESKPSDFQVKAAYLYNFGRFVEWPGNVTAGDDNVFTVCILGQDPFGPILDSTLAGEVIANKRVLAKRISSPQDSTNCRILFLSSSEDGRLSKILASLNKAAVLTVSDMPQFAERGGMIQFVLEGNRVRFEVNLTATQKAGLSPSSELLKVATSVRRYPALGD